MHNKRFTILKNNTVIFTVFKLQYLSFLAFQIHYCNIWPRQPMKDRPSGDHLPLAAVISMQIGLKSMPGPLNGPKPRSMKFIDFEFTIQKCSYCCQPRFRSLAQRFWDGPAMIRREGRSDSAILGGKAKYHLNFQPDLPKLRLCRQPVPGPRSDDPELPTARQEIHK